jgi:hypothetical protein
MVPPKESLNICKLDREDNKGVGVIHINKVRVTVRVEIKNSF